MAFDTAYGDVCGVVDRIGCHDHLKRVGGLGLDRRVGQNNDGLQFYESIAIVFVDVCCIAFPVDA